MTPRPALLFFVALLFFLYSLSVFAETVKGVRSDGAAYVLTRFASGPLVEFCVIFKDRR